MLILKDEKNSWSGGEGGQGWKGKFRGKGEEGKGVGKRGGQGKFRGARPPNVFPRKRKGTRMRSIKWCHFQ